MLMETPDQDPSQILLWLCPIVPGKIVVLLLLSSAIFLDSNFWETCQKHF